MKEYWLESTNGQGYFQEVKKEFHKRTTMKPNNPTAEHVLKDIKDFVDDMDVIVGEELDDLWNKGIKYATSHFRRILLKYQYEL